MNFSHFFIRRPIFAAVLSIVIVLVGGIAVFQLPIAQYPEIAPPTVVVRAIYPGANPKVLAETVATPIEQEVNGVENMLYMSSTSTSDGVMSLTVTFKLGTDLNTAQVLVQNRVSIALPKLPEEVRRLGVTTTKRSTDLTMVAHLVSPDGSRDELYLGNYAMRLDVLVSVTAEIARNYFELRGLQNQLAVAHKNAEVQTETLKITQSRLEGGRGTDFDVSRSRSLLNLTLSTIPPLEAAIERTIYRLAVLIGQQPTALTAELSPPAALPSAMPAIALANPEALLRRRPDIRSAERSLAAATARIGVATADLFPRVTFVGSIGLQADTFAGLGKNGADTWNFGPRITWAALDLGRVHARIEAADARAEAELALYERTVLTALEETEGALVDFGHEQSRQRFLEASTQASQQAVDLAHQRYEAGASDFLSVLDTERTLLEAQDRLAASQTRTATALVAVYKALGGGVPVSGAK